MKNKILVVLALWVNCSIAVAQEFVLSSPPYQDRATSESAFVPMAEFLTNALGVTVRYEYAANWPIYLRNMQRSQYDILLDAPHFASWRMEKIEHSPVVKLNGDLQYILYRTNRRPRIENIEELKGKPVCANAIPDLDALTILDQYASPWAQPDIVVKQGPQNIHQGLLSNDCRAAILSRSQFESLVDKRGIGILFESPSLSNFAVTVSPRLSQSQEQAVLNALLSPESVVLNRGLEALLGQPIEWVATDPDEFRGYAYLLDDYWGF